MKFTDSQYKEKTKKKLSRKGSHWGEEGITGSGRGGVKYNKIHSVYARKYRNEIHFKIINI